MDAEDNNSIDFIKPLVSGLKAYDNFADLQHRLINFENSNVKIDFGWEGRLGRTYLFLIISLFYLANQNDKKLKITVTKKIYDYLKEMKFIEEPKVNITPDGSLRFRRLSQEEHTIAMAKDIVNNIPVKLSLKLHEDMVSRIGEMFNNAREHALAKHVLGCRYSKPGKKFCFACYDTGIGIVKSVLNYHNNERLSDETALRWALAPYNSTASKHNKPRGLGLDLLKQFSKANKGEIRICTGNISYKYLGNTDVEQYKPLKNRFIGTLFEMDINAFDGKYAYGDERNDNN